MIFNREERDRLDKVLHDAGFSPEKFDFELLEINDIYRRDKSFAPVKRYKVTRQTNGKSDIYTIGPGSAWPDDVRGDLIAGKFGPP